MGDGDRDRDIPRDFGWMAGLDWSIYSVNAEKGMIEIAGVSRGMLCVVGAFQGLLLSSAQIHTYGINPAKGYQDRISVPTERG